MGLATLIAGLAIGLVAVPLTAEPAQARPMPAAYAQEAFNT